MASFTYLNQRLKCQSENQIRESEADSARKTPQNMHIDYSALISKKIVILFWFEELDGPTTCPDCIFAIRSVWYLDMHRAPDLPVIHFMYKVGAKVTKFLETQRTDEEPFTM